MQVLACAAVALLSGCRMGPQPASTALSVPQLTYEVSYFSGSPMSGPARADINSLQAQESFAITAAFAAIERAPTESLDLVDSQTRMITAFPADRLVTSVARLARGARLGFIEDTRQLLDSLTGDTSNSVFPLEELSGVLPPGITASFRVAQATPLDGRRQDKEMFEIQVFRMPVTDRATTGELKAEFAAHIALIFRGYVVRDIIDDQDDEGTTEENREDSTLQEAEGLITETVFLKPQSFGQRRRLAIAVPSPFSKEDIKALAVVIEVQLPPEEDAAEVAEHSVSFGRCLEHLERRDIQDGGLRQRQSYADWPGLEDAILALLSLPSRRRALFHLARETDALFVEDIALSATEQVVTRVAKAVASDYLAGSIDDPKTLGWVLERTAYGTLADLITAGQATPEVEALLARHAGEVGRHTSALEEVIASATGIRDLSDRVIRENLIYLEDMSPAARTRAFEWLAAKGRAPVGYDPLASVKDRRAALNQIAEDYD